MAIVLSNGSHQIYLIPNLDKKFHSNVHVTSSPVVYTMPGAMC